MRDVQSAFMRYLDIPSWEIAMERFPEHSKVDRLEPFLDLPFKANSMPASFVSFCQSAKRTATVSNSEASTDGKTVSVGKVNACVVTVDILRVTTQELLSAAQCHGFCGLNLTILDPPMV